MVLSRKAFPNHPGAALDGLGRASLLTSDFCFLLTVARYHQYCIIFCYDDHYRPKRSLGQGNIFTPVCHSVHRGGRGSPSLGGSPCQTPTPPAWRTPPDQTPPPPGADPPSMENPPPPEQTPPHQTPPPDGEPPPPGSRLRHTVYDRPVRILLECILVLCLITRVLLIGLYHSCFVCSRSFMNFDIL